MITFNSLHFIKDEKPWFPIMGEYQYSRTDMRFWKEDLAKMKAVGVDIVSSYVIWIHHEEEKGTYDFCGNKSLRNFLQAVKDSDMMMCLRIGPWVHAEVRNGGFPDWIAEQGYEPRTNDKLYLKHVKDFFTKLYEQCRGFMYGEGGPIFSVQVENEYSQWGYQSDVKGDVHINALIEMLKEIGFDVPLYFATGWGDAAIGNAIPVWGAYCDAPWERHGEKLPPMDCYLFSQNPNDENIGSDTGKKQMDIDMNYSCFPFAMVELGSGIQVTKVRRPVVLPDDNTAITVCKLGSGMSNIGYYVFRGGINPVGKTSFLQEYRDKNTQAPGFCCDLPKLDYDFQAPISQYGRVRENALSLKLINYFLRDFGNMICKMRSIIPCDSVSKVDDFHNLRYAIRYNGHNGFVFINNYVREYDLTDKELKNFSIEIDSKKLKLLDMKIQNKQFYILPFDMPLKNAVLKRITATPLCKLNDCDYIFWSYDGKCTYEIDGAFDGKIIVLNHEDALHGYKFNFQGCEHFFISDGEMYEEQQGDISARAVCLKVYPELRNVSGMKEAGKDGLFTVYELPNIRKSIPVQFNIIEQKADYISYEINIDYGDMKFDRAFVNVHFIGDRIEFFIGGQFILDKFYNGQSAEIGLNYYDLPGKITAKVYAMEKDEPVYIEQKYDFNRKTTPHIKEVVLDVDTKYILK